MHKDKLLCSFYVSVVWRDKTEYEHKFITVQFIQIIIGLPILIVSNRNFRIFNSKWSYDKMLNDWVRSGRTGKYLDLGQDVRTLSQIFSRPFSVNKYIIFVLFNSFCFGRNPNLACISLLVSFRPGLLAKCIILTVIVKCKFILKWQNVINFKF